MTVLPRLLRSTMPAILIACTVAVVPAAAQDAARVPVQTLSDGLIAIMKGGKKLGLSGRVQQITPVIDRSFDLALMTRLAVGAPWTSASPADRAGLLAAFRRLTINEYARNFSSWSGEQFTIDPKVDARAGDKLVRTTLTAPKGEPVTLAYRLRQSDGDWRIIDVYYQNSISQLAMRRADFASMLAKGGPKALIAHLNGLAEKAMR